MSNKGWAMSDGSQWSVTFSVSSSDVYFSSFNQTLHPNFIEQKLISRLNTAIYFNIDFVFFNLVDFFLFSDNYWIKGD